MLFNSLLEEMKKEGIRDFEVVIEKNNYIIRKLIESRKNLLLSTNKDKIKYVVKI